MRCKHESCTRRAHTSGFCTTHYRRRRDGKPMDAPIRRYVHLQDHGNSADDPGTASTVRRKRKKPFEAEYALLAELGLRRL